MGTFTYRLQKLDTGFIAQCCETDLAGEGPTRAEAVESLRSALAAELDEPNAVAPPSRPTVTDVVLTEAPPREHAGPQGPGDAM